MVSAISRTTNTGFDDSKPRRSASMDAQLSTARAKLEDWVTCPSAKTPEGKAEIGKASAKLQSIKAEIKKQTTQARKPVRQLYAKPAPATPSRSIPHASPTKI